MPGKPGFRVGDSVVVKPGVLCPDKPSLSLAGWQGRVTVLYPEDGTAELKWDSLTLRAMLDDYILECELEGLGWETMVLELDEVLPARPRDTQKKAEAVYKDILAHHAWDHLADVNPGIREVVGHLGNADSFAYLQAWEEHLEQTLQFPFEAHRVEMLTRGPVQEGDIVQVLGIGDVDDDYGLFAEVHLDRDTYAVPLCDLEATGHTSSNYQPLKDYVVWFANR